MAPIDLEKSRELKGILESLTHSGSKDLNKEELNIILESCREKEYLSEVEGEIMEILKEEHSEIRYSAVQVIDELFMKFEEFRTNLVKGLHEYFKYALGVHSKEKLPPPRAAAIALQDITVSNLIKWKKAFYDINKLHRAIHYLQTVGKMDICTFELCDPILNKRQKEWEIKVAKLHMELKKTNEEVEDLMPELKNTITSLESCFDLLIPLPDESEYSNTALESSSGNVDMRVFGIVNPKHSVQIEFGNEITVHVDEDNSAIVEAAKDAFTLIHNRYHPKIKAWVEIIKRVEGNGDLMNKATKLKDDLDLIISKYHRINFVKETKMEMEDEDLDSSDSDLEEVPELKPSAREQTNREIRFLTFTLRDSSRKEKKKPLEKGDPIPGPSGSSTGVNDRKKQLLAIAPKVNFDIDYHWEDEKLPTPTMLAEGSRFWGGQGSEELVENPVPEGAAAGTWEPVSHTCRAPLPSGKLCPRQDRFKCPFHGIIVNRDEAGRIINKDDEEKVAKSKPKPDVPDWQDPRLLADIKAQTGIDLKMPEKGKRIKKKKYPGLTDITGLQGDTPVYRWTDKCYTKESEKRFSEAFDKLDVKKFRDAYDPNLTWEKWNEINERDMYSKMLEIVRKNENSK